MPPFVAVDQAPEIPFIGPPAQSRAARLQVSRINHDRRWFRAFSSKPLIVRRNTPISPSASAIVQRLVGAILQGRIAPAQPVAVHKYDAAMHTPIINARLAPGSWK
jgi:hypothetical protein